MVKFAFTETQAQAILDMRLQRITGLERDKIKTDLDEALKHIEWIKEVLADVREIYRIISEELTEIKKKYSNPRLTKIESDSAELEDEDLIKSEDVIVCITNSGYIKRIPVDEYRIQRRGGKGLKGAETREEDYVAKILTANTLTTILAISDKGRLYWLKVHRIPEGSRTSKGKAIANVLNLTNGEQIRAFLPVDKFDSKKYVVMITQKGTIKKTSLEAFSNPRPSGIIALTTDLNDYLMDAKLCEEGSHIFMSTSEGMSIRFDQSDVRPMGRTARGVRGMTMGSDTDQVVGADVIPPDCTDAILVVTKNGFGKRSSVEEYRLQGRGGVGTITQKITDKVGNVVSVKLVSETDQVMITTDKGQSIRMKVSDISLLGRNTQGVKLINLNEGEFVTGLALIAEGKDDESAEGPALQ